MSEENIFCIVVTFNGEKWIDKCLTSIVNSNIAVDIIVVDNCSSDSTIDIVKKRFPAVSLYQTYNNIGFGRANNIGIKRALERDAKYVFLLNQDAWVEGNTISQLVSCQIKNKDYGILSPVQFNGEGGLDTRFESYLNSYYTPNIMRDYFCEFPIKELYETKYVNAAAWLLPVSTLELIGGFSHEFFHYGEDDNFIHRCIYKSIKIGIVAGARVHHDRDQILKPIEEYTFSELVNYIYRLVLVDLLDPNTGIKLKLKKSFIHILKGLIRNPIAVFPVIIKLIVNYRQISGSLSKFRKPGNYGWVEGIPFKVIRDIKLKAELS